MGHYICQFGKIHRTCRCPTTHHISCDKVSEHKPVPPIPFRGTQQCLVWTMRKDGRLPYPKHLLHEPHDWYYTSWGGGHQLADEPDVNDPDYKHTSKLHCPGDQ